MGVTQVRERQIGAFGKVELIESSTPATPTSGNEYLYFKTDGKLYKKNSAGVESEVAVKTVTFGVDGSGAVITTGEKTTTIISLPFSGTIVEWRLTSKEATTMTVDIWANDSADPTNSDSITASAKPSLTAAKFASSSSLSGWTTGVAKGKIFKIEVESDSASTYFTLILTIV